MILSKHYEIKRVEPHQLLEALAAIKQNETIAFDTETTGLRWMSRKGYPSDEPFCLVVCSDVCVWVFFLKDFTSFSDKLLIASIFENPKIIFAHNAKFDMHMMCNYFGPWKPPANILDTAVLANLIDNTRFKYSLDSLAKDYLGENKIDTVKDYINEHHLFTNLVVNGKPERQLHFDKVPDDLIETYAAHDSWLTYKLGTHLLERAKSFARPLPIELEMKTTNVLWHMEREGISVDHDYVHTAKQELEKKIADCKEGFKEWTGLDFIDHRHTFDKIFTGAPKTEKGNSSYTDEFLSKSENPVANIILNHRHATKKLTTYFENFEFFETTSGKIHCDFRQSGAASGRFSAVNPALQTLPRDESGDIPIRRSFVPRENYFLVSIDYQAIEMRVMFDLAASFNFKQTGSRGLKIIDEIINGKDMHQVTADMMKVKRQYAKTLGFMLLYGGGAGKLAESLDVTLDEAKYLKNKYFAVMPEVKRFIAAVIKKAEIQGFIQGPSGRVWRFQRDFAYKAPNYLIQGTCSDIMRKALINCQKLLESFLSRLILSVHDECVFEIHKSEEFLIPQILEAMRTSYKHYFLPMDCDVEYSAVSWFDKESYETRNTV